MKTNEAIRQLNNATTQRLTVREAWGYYGAYDFPWGVEALTPRHRAIVQDPLSGHWECIAANDHGLSLVFQYVPAETLEQKINRLLAAGWCYEFWHPGTGNGEDAYHWTPPIVFQSNRHGKVLASPFPAPASNYAALKEELDRHADQMRAILLKFFRENDDSK